MAEVIKYGVIWDADLFAQMEQCDRLDQLRHKAAHCKKSSRSCQAKADVVSKDEKKPGSGQFQLWSHHWSCWKA